MENLIEKSSKDKDTKLSRIYKIAIETINENSFIRPINSLEAPICGAKPLVTEFNKGLAFSNEKTFFLFRDRYFLGVHKINGVGLEDNISYGFVETIIQIPEKRHISRTNYNWGPKPTLELIYPDLWSKCLENRKKVLDQIVEKYKLKTYWNDNSAFDYLLGQIGGGYNYLKRKKFKDLDEKEAVKKSESFMDALREWIHNDPIA